MSQARWGGHRTKPVKGERVSLPGGGELEHRLSLGGVCPPAAVRFSWAGIGVWGGGGGNSERSFVGKKVAKDFRRTLSAGLPEMHISGALFCVFGLHVIWGVNFDLT